MGLPPNIAQNVTGVLANGTKSAAVMAHSEQQGEKTPGAFDVMTHTVDGLATRMEQALDDPASVLQQDPVQQARVDTAMSLGHWESSSIESMVDSVVVQASGLEDQWEAVKDAKGALPTIGAGFALLTGVEQMISTTLSIIPFPAFPAIRVTDTAVGLPHAHAHPPNLIPPNPVPVPLPSMGPVIPIPFLSGASKTLVNGMPAARCGDMGVGVWCGGYFPMYEIFLGSSNVWIEGSRAARVGVDITKHCIFTTPRPQDPPIGPMVGMTVSSSANVLIGGVPMPSLLSWAMGRAIKGLFKGFGKLVGKLKAGKAAKEMGESAAFSRAVKESADDATQVGGKTGKDTIDYAANYVKASQLVQAMEDAKSIIINGSDEFQEAVRKDLRQIACSNTGRKVLEDIHASPKTTYIEHLDQAPSGRPSGAHAEFHSSDLKTPGVGSDTTVRYDPSGGSPGSPPDATLNHELGHARSAANGTNKVGNTEGLSEGMKNRWTDWEEIETIDGVDNPYRAERGLPQRLGHNHLPQFLD